ncbi:LLM class flavin-dependent oxidoreductase [Umezawaea endophytica]|uniref:LLM class flavin-dependent oxidoreductase n=1 Tax=Umezawaea endophytica TaxID=1654476 RepID=A0A9X2VIC8_9PSEU|nr:LLM class flavin-dependent oxidoreductase [Umezawaea endophytica]MCS7477205.1 LLM class flavin-dependent oxidoreductase [Umezawaea endophytica]
MTLSVLDLSPVVSGQRAADALRNTLDLARHAERLGYRRYWLAEHHLTPGVASTSPAVLIAAVAAATEEIRVGSGAVLLGYYAPLVVAEQFGLLANLHPGRIDLGLGRSGAVRESDLAKHPVFSAPEFIARYRLQQGLLGVRPGAEEPPYAEQVGQVLGFVGGDHHANVVEGADFAVWVLGSSAGESAVTAGALGLPFAAAYHVSPRTAQAAVDAYREAFVPSERLAEPYVVISADVVVAEDEAVAVDLAAPYGQWVLSIRTGDGAIPFPSPEEAAAFEWTDEAHAKVADRTATQFVGAPADVAERLHELKTTTGADEVLVTTIVHDHAARVRSYELLAKAWAQV